MKKLALASAVTFMTLLGACGGAQQDASGGAGTSAAGEGAAPPAPAAVPVAETQTEGGTAAAGAPCDFGGAERHTCESGLQCCYGTGSPTYGACQRDCSR